MVNQTSVDKEQTRHYPSHHNAIGIENGSLVCDRHPETETGLRCNRCNRPMCVKCARLTPVGYKCVACVRHIQDRFFDGKWSDYIVASLIALPLSVLAIYVFTFFMGEIGGFSWLIAFLAAPTMAGIIAEAVRRGVSKRRSRYLANVVASCLVVAVLPFLLLTVLWGDFAGVISPGILLVLGTETIRARLR